MYRIILTGRLVADPTLRTVSVNGADRKVCNFRTATNLSKENTRYTDIAVWNGLAEACAKYLTKGRQVLIDGTPKAQHSKRENDGVIFDHMLVSVSTIEFLGAGPHGEDVKQDVNGDEITMSNQIQA